ncbi:MAG TPA: histidine phosphatase family protein [Candidatus Saccharimonadales bacterium]|nr:histidine phosphatase family protein [Candidatus Saccharimonadales bacterium]
MKKLYFVRHGLSEMNKSGHYAGRTNTPLAEEGRIQAQKAGEKAKKLDIDLIVSSPLSRALETAQIIADEIGYPPNKIMVNDILQERSWGDWEGRRFRPIKEDEFDKIPNAEKSHELISRAEKALRFLESLPVENILVVSHGTFGRALRHHIIDDMPFVAEAGNEKLRLPNGEVIEWI